MKTKKVIDEMVKLIVEHGTNKLEPMLIESLKEYYGVKGLYFWRDSDDWGYCTEIDPNKLYKTWGTSHRKYMDLKELEYALNGLEKKQCTIIFEGRRCKDLDEIKQFILIKRLAGI